MRALESSKKKTLRESAGEKKSRMKAAPGTFLNEGENKRRRIEISTTCVKKKNVWMK